MRRAEEIIVDVETRVRHDHHQSLRLWLRLLACRNLIEARVRMGLRASFNTTLSRFDFMAQLDRVPEGLKMSELSQRLMVTGGNVTGLANGLEREGLIAREDDPNDGRACRVKLTRSGRQLFAKMAKAHEAWVVNLLQDLGTRDKQMLVALLGRLRVDIRRNGEARDR